MERRVRMKYRLCAVVTVDRGSTAVVCVYGVHVWRQVEEVG